QIDVALHVQRLDFEAREVRVARQRHLLRRADHAVLRAGRRGGERDDGGEAADEQGREARRKRAQAHCGSSNSATGSVFSRSRYSGYIVATPPSVASCGNACFAAYSAAYGFSPRR